jgi:hypothetical protein
MVALAQRPSRPCLPHPTRRARLRPPASPQPAHHQVPGRDHRPPHRRGRSGRDVAAPLCDQDGVADGRLDRRRIEPRRLYGLLRPWWDAGACVSGLTCLRSYAAALSALLAIRSRSSFTASPPGSSAPVSYPSQREDCAAATGPVQKARLTSSLPPAPVHPGASRRPAQPLFAPPRGPRYVLTWPFSPFAAGARIPVPSPPDAPGGHGQQVAQQACASEIGDWLLPAARYSSRAAAQAPSAQVTATADGPRPARGGGTWTCAR